MPIGDYNPVLKPEHKRNKPKAGQRGQINNNVRKSLHERSKGICEKCGKARAVHAAHTLRRMDIRVKTTVEDLCHVCLECHRYMDSTTGGAVFKQTFREAAYRKTGRDFQYYM